MKSLHEQSLDDLRKLAPPEEPPQHDEYLAIVQRIERLQLRIVDGHRNLKLREAQHATSPSQGQDAVGDIAEQLSFQKNYIAQHESEVDFYLSQLERLRQSTS